jgi:hypothetical protein
MRRLEQQGRAFALGFKAGRRWRAKEVREVMNWLESELHDLREEMLHTAGAQARLHVLKAGWLDAEDPVLH